jgi:tetratricopeptide (TPR) repeat protein
MNLQDTSVCEQAYQRAISGEFVSSEEAIAFLENFQGKCRTDLLFQSRLAALYFVVGRVDDAERLIQDGLRLDPTHEKLLFSLGDVRLKQRQLDSVVAIASKIIEHHPDSHGGYYLMQLGLIYAGRYEESISFGREAILRAELPALWLNEAVACFQIERFEQCVVAAYCAIQLDPTVLQERWGINEAIYALAKQGMEDEALELALRRKQVTPNWQDDPVFVKALTLLTN